MTRMAKVPFLSGEALKVIQDLEAAAVNNYDLLKGILSRRGLTQSGRAQHFHSWAFSNDQSPRAQMHELICLTKHWQEPDQNSSAAIVKLVVRDRYLRAQPLGAKQVVGQNLPATTSALVKAVEDGSSLTPG